MMDLLPTNHRESSLMGTPRYPSLYQINTRVWLTELSRMLGRSEPASKPFKKIGGMTNAPKNPCL